MAESVIDLDALKLRSGEARAIELELRPAAPVIGGRPHELTRLPVPARVDVSRTTAGYALRLRAETSVEGVCVRCLGGAVVRLELDRREVDQSSDESELNSPYVVDEGLDAEAWLSDAIRLELPDKVLCRNDCAGLCPECGVALNDLEPGSHTHEPQLDPRFAKLRELQADPGSGAGPAEAAEGSEEGK